MDERAELAESFEANRPHLRKVAYRMLGSMSEADDAVQDAWLRLERSDPAGVDDLRAWLTTVVARICLDQLRAKRAHADVVDLSQLAEPVDLDEMDHAPEGEAILADSVGVALLVVLETLTPTERVSFVLHDVFGLPFEEIAPVIGRSVDAARQSASRARRRVQNSSPGPESDPATRRRVVDAFLAASRAGDFDALVRVLDPGVVLHLSLNSPGERTVRVAGAPEVAKRVLANGSRLAHLARRATVSGSTGLIVGSLDDPISVVAFTVVGERIVEIDLLADPSKIPAQVRQAAFR
jgi:RNA polymerase sigma-70 factor (ECF subfamily)